jgi:hypothetical protein
MQQIAVISLVVLASAFLVRRVFLKKKRCDSCAPVSLTKGKHYGK